MKEYHRAFEFRVDSYPPTGIRIDGFGRIFPTQARQLRLHHADRLEREVREPADLERPLPA